MLDLLHLPPQFGAADVQVFNRPATATNTQWQSWTAPRGKSMLSIMCIGGGGGGGGGFTGLAAAARGGGGGGGSSGTTRVIVPLFLLPERLFIQVGAGGQGVGSGGGTAGQGIQSLVAIAPDSTATNVLAFTSATGPTGGGTGTGAAVGAVGTAGSAAAITSFPLAGLGIYEFVAGHAGTLGGAVAGAIGGTQGIPANGIVTMGGAGGAGTTSADFAGGSISVITGAYLSEQRPAAPAAGSFNGSGGLQLWKPFFSFGGLGGSSSNTGIGGLGGNGAHGAGGGGGGGGTTGGRGGDGGSGVVIMICW